MTIISCNKFDENLNSDDNNDTSDSTSNNFDCNNCIYSYEFEIITLE